MKKNVHPDNNARNGRLEIRDHIKQSQSEWIGAELLENIMGKGLHNFSKDAVGKLKNHYLNQDNEAQKFHTS